MTRTRQSSSVSAYTESSASIAAGDTPLTSPATSYQSPLSPSKPNLDQELHEDGKPKRPMNVFLVYSRWRRESGRLAQEFEGTPRSEWSTRLGKEWKTLPSAERAKWIEHYNQLRKRFDQLFPDYVYTRSSRRQSAGTAKKSKSSSATTSKGSKAKPRGDSYSPPKKAWSKLGSTRNSSRRKSAPEYREREESPLTEDESEIEEEMSDGQTSSPQHGRSRKIKVDDDDDYEESDEDGEYELEIEEEQIQLPKAQDHQPRAEAPSFGLGLYGMNQPNAQVAPQHIDSPASVESERDTPVHTINYESAPVPRNLYPSWRIPNSFEESSYNFNQPYNQIYNNVSTSRAPPQYNGAYQYHPQAPNEYASYYYNSNY